MPDDVGTALDPTPPPDFVVVQQDGEQARRHPGMPLKPVGAWATTAIYDPERASKSRAEDFVVDAPTYARRFGVLARDVEATFPGYAPDDPIVTKAGVSIPGMPGQFVATQVEGVFMAYVPESHRFKPIRIKSKAELHQFNESEYGRQKRLVESGGFGIDPFGDDPMGGGSQDSTRLLDTEFVPLMSGPFFKQLYIHDYLMMHSRAFEMVNHNALAAAAVKIMQRFTVGRGINYDIKDDACKQVFDEFWQRNNMRDIFRQMARDLPWQGELMLRFYEHARGKTGVRILDPSTCWEIVTDPEDFAQVYYYHFQWPCVHGTTKIACLDGTNPTIAELAARQATDGKSVWVYSYDHTQQRIVPGEASKIWKAGRKRCVEVELDNGEKIIASFDHPFMRRNGTYCKAEQLAVGESLMPLYRRTGYEEVWQPDADDGRWQATHKLVGDVIHGPKPSGTLIHHANDVRTNNHPDNVQYVKHGEHSRLHHALRRKNAAYDPNRVTMHQTMSRAAKRNWAAGTYDFLKQPRTGETKWRQRIAAGVKRSWQDPEKRIRRLIPLVKAVKASWQDPVKRRCRIDAIRVANQRRNHTVVAVRPVGMHTVYDMQVDKHHNFALTAGVFTHNTPYQIWTSGQIPVARYIIQEVPPTNILHVKINVSSQEKRGRSDFLPAMPWLKRFNDFYNGQTVKAVLEANLVFKIKIKGDQADVQNFLTNAALTELPPPGGTWVENEAVDLQPISAQLSAGRGSQGIGQQIAAIVAASLNLPNEYFNIEAGTGAARATALVRTDPAVKTIEDRQQVLKEVGEGIYDRVIADAILAKRLDRSKARRDPELQFGQGGDYGPNDDDSGRDDLDRTGRPTQRASLSRTRG